MSLPHASLKTSHLGTERWQHMTERGIHQYANPLRIGPRIGPPHRFQRIGEGYEGWPSCLFSGREIAWAFT